MTTIQSQYHSKTAQINAQSFDTIDHLFDHVSQASKSFKFSFSKTVANQTSLSNTIETYPCGKPNAIIVNKNSCPYIISKTVSPNTIIKTACGCHLASYSQYCHLHKSTKVNWERVSEINASNVGYNHQSSNNCSNNVTKHGKKYPQYPNDHSVGSQYNCTGCRVTFKPNINVSRVKSRIVSF